MIHNSELVHVLLVILNLELEALLAIREVSLEHLDLLILLLDLSLELID